MVASPEIIEQVLATFHEASQSNWQTPGRQGSLVVISPEMADDVMITGDLHGHRHNFNRILEIADLDNHARRHLILQEVCHGGPVYPGTEACMSHTMLEDVAGLKAAYPDRVHFILSNHELAELTDYPIIKANILLNLLFRMGIQIMYGEASERVREALVSFLKSCPLAIRLPGQIFVSHTLPEAVDEQGFDTTIFQRDINASDLKKSSSLFSLVWGRDFRPENAAAFAKLVDAEVLIHGHEPTQEGFSVPNDQQIILDCSGHKACYVILPTDEPLSHKKITQQIKSL